ncbi:MAG: MOSC domain-containing protein [Pseudomonadota bacterium]
MGRLQAIARKAAARAPMESLETVEISLEAGLAGDHRGTSLKRQVTVLTREGWATACRLLSQDIAWTVRRANLFISGVPLTGHVGAVLEVGPVRLEITGECAPCARMDEQVPGLRLALAPAWRGGVTARVLSGGAIKRGDDVRLLSPAGLPL